MSSFLKIRSMHQARQEEELQKKPVTKYLLLLRSKLWQSPVSFLVRSVVTMRIRVTAWWRKRADHKQ
jgi:hypothetical protein